MMLHLNLQEDAELRKAVLELVRGALRTDLRGLIQEEIDASFKRMDARILGHIDKQAEYIKQRTSTQVDQPKSGRRSRQKSAASCT